MRLALVLLVASLAACAGAARPRTTPMPPPTIRLVDSVAWSNELADGLLWRVEVRSGERTLLLPGVLTSERPVVTGTGEVLGFVWNEDQVVAGFAHDARTGRTRRLPLPDDFDGIFSAHALSPDGRHLAYVDAPGDGTGSAVVRTWPDRRLVLRSRAVEVPATDSPGNFTRWLSPDSAEVFVETGFSTGDAWLRVLMSARSGRILATDTVRRAPWQ
jgi:Tol biopolymer transport system component